MKVFFGCNDSFNGTIPAGHQFESDPLVNNDYSITTIQYTHIINKHIYLMNLQPYFESSHSPLSIILSTSLIPSNSIGNSLDGKHLDAFTMLSQFGASI